MLTEQPPAKAGGCSVSFVSVMYVMTYRNLKIAYSKNREKFDPSVNLVSGMEP
jgi:hypothetical protein